MRNSLWDLFSLPEDFPKKTKGSEESDFESVLDRLFHIESFLIEMAGDDDPEVRFPDFWGPGSLPGDLFRVLSPKTSVVERRASAQRLRANAQSLARSPEGRIVIRDMAQERGQDVGTLESELLPAATWLVDRHSKTPQQIRVGKDYIKDEDGEHAEIVPVALTTHLYLLEYWAIKEIRNAVEAAILGQPYPSVLGDAMDQDIETISPEAPDTITPPHPDEIQLTEEILSALTPSERAVVLHLHDDPSLTNQQLATLLGSNSRSIAAIKSKALKKLKTLLKPR